MGGAMRPAAAPDWIARIVASDGKHSSGACIGDGLVVSCAHGLSAGVSITVIFRDGRRQPATIAAQDHAHDLTLLRVDTQPKNTLALAEPAMQGTSVRVGGYGSRDQYAELTTRVLGYEKKTIVIRGSVRQGDSGGPIYTDAGLVGVVSECRHSGGPWSTAGASVVVVRKLLDQVIGATKPAPDKHDSNTSNRSLASLSDRVEAMEARLAALEARTPQRGPRGAPGEPGPAGPRGMMGPPGPPGKTPEIDYERITAEIVRRLEKPDEPNRLYWDVVPRSRK
jgi:hypothetical protein